MSFLELQGLTKRYDDFTAVGECSLSVAKGEFVCLLGPSGCGKTTTLQMVAGFVQPTSGRILLDGQDITARQAQQARPGHRVPELCAVPAHDGGRQRRASAWKCARVDVAERRKRVDETLELVHLGPMAGRYPRELSGGQRQRVALARALVIQPPVLLLDEPMGALDAKLREEMQIELRVLQHRVGITTIMVTHDQAEAMTLADRVVLMNKGRIEQVGRPFDMYEQPNGRFSSTFLGKANVFEGRASGDSVDVNGHRLPCGERRCLRRRRLHRATGEGRVCRRAARWCAAASARGYSSATTGCSRSRRRSARCSSLTPTPACRKRPRATTVGPAPGRPSTPASCRAGAVA